MIEDLVGGSLIQQKSKKQTVMAYDTGVSAGAMHPKNFGCDESILLL